MTRQAVERRRVVVGGAPVAYTAVGDGPPLLLVHGLGGSGRWWVRNVEPLSHHFRVYTVDLVGFGGSRGRRQFVLDQAAATIRDWMDAVGIQRAHLVGHSMGGFIAVEFAVDYPERLDHLVLVAAAALPLGRRPLGHALALAILLRTLPLDFLPTLLWDGLRAGPVTLLRAARSLVASSAREKLASIQAPTLVVWGAGDALVPVSLGQEIAQVVPGARLEVLQRAGHNPMWDQAALFNHLLLQFLREPARQTASSRAKGAPLTTGIPLAPTHAMKEDTSMPSRDARRPSHNPLPELRESHQEHGEDELTRTSPSGGIEVRILHDRDDPPLNEQIRRTADHMGEPAHGTTPTPPA